MSKYSGVSRREYVRPYKIHPIWRGIGFVMIVLVPIIAWFAAQEISMLGKDSSVPQVKSFFRSLSSPVAFPDWVYSVPVLREAARGVRSIPMFKSTVLLFFILVLVFSGILSIIYAMIYRAAVPRYGPLDEPAPKIRPKKYTR
jgi:hypothetical protein